MRPDRSRNPVPSKPAKGVFQHPGQIPQGGPESMPLATINALICLGNDRIKTAKSVNCAGNAG